MAKCNQLTSLPLFGRFWCCGSMHCVQRPSQQGDVDKGAWSAWCKLWRASASRWRLLVGRPTCLRYWCTFWWLRLSLTLSVPHFFWLWQKWIYQSIQGHTGLTHPLSFWHSALWHSFLSASAPMSKTWKGWLDQYGPEHFVVSTGLKGVNCVGFDGSTFE